MQQAQRAAFESQLASLLERGDLAAAATELVRGYGPEIRGSLAVALGSREAADEVYASFGEELRRDLPGFTVGSASFRTWAYTLAWRTARRWLRDPDGGQGVIRLDTGFAEAPRDPRSPLGRLVRTSAREPLARLRRGLSPDEQMLLTLRLDRQLSWREVGQVLCEPDEPRGDATACDRYQRLVERLAPLASQEGLLAYPLDTLLGALAQAPELEAPLAEGDRIERFVIVRRLGEGGFGRVYLARDTRLRRLVALKVADRAPVGVAALRLFEREAQATAALNHPGIVTIHDWGTTPRGEPYLVLEYLEGETLRERLERDGVLTSHQTSQIASEVLEALGYAHAAGVIHGDLKPENIYLCDDGRVKVLDFGMAHLDHVAPEADPGGEAESGLYRGGTPSYMAPEKWRGEAPDARSDLWSVGIVMYEMLAGARPYASSELPREVLGPCPVPSIRLRLPAVPQALEQAIARALAKRRAARVASAEDLLGLVYIPEVVAPPPPALRPAPRPAWHWLAVSLAAASAASAAQHVLGRYLAPEPPPTLAKGGGAVAREVTPAPPRGRAAAPGERIALEAGPPARGPDLAPPPRAPEPAAGKPIAAPEADPVPPRPVDRTAPVGPPPAAAPTPRRPRPAPREPALPSLGDSDVRLISALGRGIAPAEDCPEWAGERVREARYAFGRQEFKHAFTLARTAVHACRASITLDGVRVQVAHDSAAWAIIGASACEIGNATVAHQAWRHLRRGSALQHDLARICGRTGVALDDPR